MLASDFFAAALSEGEGNAAQVAVHLTTTDLAGNPISTVAAGERFLLQASVEDLRLDAQGVFAAYLDVTFDPNQADLLGSVLHGPNFQNGISANLDQPGLIDEAGGFRTTLFAPGVAKAELFSVLMTAEATGELVFEASPADIIPDHEILLYEVDTAIPRSSIEFGRTSIEVTSLEGSPHLAAADDSYQVLAGTRDNPFEVLLNDAGFGDLAVLEVDSSGLSGEVTIAPGGRTVLYTPGLNFSGSEQFTYTVGDAEGATDNAIVTVQVNASNSGDEVVSIRLMATDYTGRQIDSVTDGDDFLLSAFVEDTRAEAQGVFAAYFDLYFDDHLVQPAGEVVFDPEFTNGVSRELDQAGLLDEVGAFRQSIVPVHQGESLLFTLPFTAIGSGQAFFESDPSDVLPSHAMLVYGDDHPVPNEQIRFGSLDLQVLSDLIGVDDSYHVSEETTTELSVLANDVHKSGDQLQIREVDTTGIRGRVEISTDGKSLFYTPEPGFGGSEQFRYQVQGARGLSSAQVTVHSQPGAAGDDLLAIDLATLDLNGNPIDTIRAGQEFWLTATVDDLRADNLDVLGVFATYFDLLYDAEKVAPVGSATNRLGFDVEFGSAYLNGQQGGITVPGVINEIGAFQTSTVPLGPDAQTLFAVRMQAATASGNADAFVVQEDAVAISLNVLENDLSNSGTTRFRSDPADRERVSDVLLFEPTDTVPITNVHYGETALQIESNGTQEIDWVGNPSHGGSVSISADGQRLVYTPAGDFFGVESFSYAFQGGPEIDVEVVVEGVPDAPLAQDDAYRVRTNRNLAIGALDGPLANDSDVDGDLLQLVEIDGPTHGILDISPDGSFVYVPESDFIGSDQFTYRAMDAALVSEVAVVEIIVEPPPVQIRLDVIDDTGTPLSHALAGQTVFVQALVKDRRDETHEYHGVGAAYLDVTYDAEHVTPLVDGSGNEVAIKFGDQYQNGQMVTVASGGLENVGAFQTGFTPLGSDEQELFTVAMQLAGMQVVDDEYTVSRDSLVNSLDVLDNEVGLIWEVPFEAAPADENPITDVVLFDPPMAVDDEDISYLDASILVSNSTDLTIVRVSTSENGAEVVVADGGRRVEYTPPAGFVGVDAFEYTVIDPNGAVGTGQVRVEVVSSWQNRHNHYDVNSDGRVTPHDALLLINEINRNGARELPPPYRGPYFFDVNGDGFLTPQDVLAVLNWINHQQALRETTAQAEGEAALRSRALPSAEVDEALLPLGLDWFPATSSQPAAPLAETFALLAREHTSASVTRPVQQPQSRLQRIAPMARAEATTADLESPLEDRLDELAAELADLWAQ